jgi:Asp-tRNA(Asn)/Glu-tRNA(Gln) amidotransferase A subunit family amidase
MTTLPLVEPRPLAPTADALRSGALDLLAYIERTTERIDAIDPQIAALMPEQDRHARLVREAIALAARYPDPDTRPPLFGVLVGIKDMFHVDGFATTAGSRVPPSALAGAEATCATRLRAAGALILGKTVTAEFAYFEPGPTRNPHNTEHTPGGSSSGSAAATAAGFCSLAIGTQTVGSVIRPAAFCGIVGFKPTFDRIPTAGLLLCSPSLDHVGIFTPDIAGMQIAAAALCDNWQPRRRERLPVLGVPDGAFLEQASPEGLTAFEQQVALLQNAGYTVVRLPMFEDIAEIAAGHTRLVQGEMAQSHRAWFPRYAELYRSRTAAAIRNGAQIDPALVDAARDARGALRSRLEGAMDRHGVDIWLSPPALGPAPTGIGATGDPAMNLPWTNAGFPTVTFPALPAADGLPLGLQCTGRWMTDELLLDWCTTLAEIVSPGRVTGQVGLKS